MKKIYILPIVFFLTNACSIKKEFTDTNFYNRANNINKEVFKNLEKE